MFQNFDAWTVVALVLGIAAAFFGVYLALAKSKLAQVVNLLHALSEAGQAVVDASADNEISPEEKANIDAKWLAVKVAAQVLVGKVPQ